MLSSYDVVLNPNGYVRIRRRNALYRGVWYLDFLGHNYFSENQRVDTRKIAFRLQLAFVESSFLSDTEQV